MSERGELQADVIRMARAMVNALDPSRMYTNTCREGHPFVWPMEVETPRMALRIALARYDEAREGARG